MFHNSLNFTNRQENSNSKSYKLQKTYLYFFKANSKFSKSKDPELFLSYVLFFFFERNKERITINGIIE